MREVAEIKFAKTRSDAIIPSKRDEDVGFDIYSCFDDDYIVINPHETKLIPTGIAGACNPNYGFIFKERSSTGSKGIAVRAGVIDSGYRNEWLVCLTNTTKKIMFISKLSEKETLDKYYSNMKSGLFTRIKRFFTKTLVYPYSKAIAQMLLVTVPKAKTEEVPYDELKEIKSERGMGGFGSTN